MPNTYGTALFGYKRKSVDRAVDALRADYERLLGEKQERLIQLRNENNHLKEELERLTSMESCISVALISARQKAQEMEQQAQQEARAHLERHAAEIAAMRRASAQLRGSLHDEVARINRLSGEFHHLLERMQRDEEQLEPMRKEA